MVSKLSDMLLAGNSRFNIDLVANFIGADQERFDELISLMLNGTDTIPQRAAWALSVITDKQPGLMAPYEATIVAVIDTFKHTAIHRCVLRYFAMVKPPENCMGQLLDVCYKYLLDNKMPPGVKVHAMQIIYNISELEPDLKEELKLTIESIYDDGVPAIKSRGGALLKKLKKDNLRIPN